MNKNVLPFVLVGAFATLCLTIISHHAISNNAVWTKPVIIVSIIGATCSVIAPIANLIHVKFKKQDVNHLETEIEFHFVKDQNIPNAPNDGFSNNPIKTIHQDLENEIKKLIVNYQDIYVKKSFGEYASQCFTTEDLENFKSNQIPVKIQNELEDDINFIVMVKKMMKISEANRKSILKASSRVYRKTWAELGEISIKGQTEAGQKADKLIAETIVDTIQRAL